MRHVFLGHHALVLQDFSQSLLDDYAVLIAVHYSCISSQEELQAIGRAKKAAIFDNIPRKVRQSIISGSYTATHEPAMRHSCSGQVIATGKSVRSLRAGDYVACVDVDLEHHADIVCVHERHTVRVSDHHHLRIASLIGPVTFALQGVREANARLGELVCVVGLDLVGRLMMQLFKFAGCRVYAIDHTARLEYSRATCHGVDEAYTYLNDSTEKAILVSTANRGVDVMAVTNVVKHEETIERLVRVIRAQGKMVFVGYKQSIVLPATLHDKEIDCLLVNSYGPGGNDIQYEQQGVEYPYIHVRWTEQRNMYLCMRLLEEGTLDIAHLIGPDIAINDLTESTEIPHMASHPCAIVRYYYDDALQQSAVQEKQRKNNLARRAAPISLQDSVRVGVVGIGNFAKTKLLPLLANTKGVKLMALVDANITNSLNVAPLYDIEHILINDDQLFASDLVDAVVIASPHKFHCDQIMRAMKAGKAVFSEKPMVTNQQQLEQLSLFLNAHAHIPLCVDYSRSYAPFMRKIKHELSRRKTPVFIHYRVNAGFVPKEHWMQTNVGAGRIIGEACYIIDLFLFLVNKQPISVSVEALHAVADNIFPTDNFSVHISFEDGSLCSILYTALGHDGMGQERMELFFDAKTIIMDDYEYLAGFGLSKSFDETAMVPDKGHAALLRHFFNFVAHKDNQAPMDIDHLYAVASLTLLIDRLACQGGGTTMVAQHAPLHDVSVKTLP